MFRTVYIFNSRTLITRVLSQVRVTLDRALRHRPDQHVHVFAEALAVAFVIGLRGRDVYPTQRAIGLRLRIEAVPADVIPHFQLQRKLVQALGQHVLDRDRSRQAVTLVQLAIHREGAFADDLYVRASLRLVRSGLFQQRLGGDQVNLSQTEYREVQARSLRVDHRVLLKPEPVVVLVALEYLSGRRDVVREEEVLLHRTDVALYVAVQYIVAHVVHVRQDTRVEYLRAIVLHPVLGLRSHTCVDVWISLVQRLVVLDRVNHLVRVLAGLDLVERALLVLAGVIAYLQGMTGSAVDDCLSHLSGL